MKTATTLTLAVAAMIIGGTAALADSPQQKNQMDLQRHVAESHRTTVAVYNDGRALGRVDSTQVRREDPRFEFRFNARGERVGMFVPAK